MVIWEVSYGPEGDFYATKREALWMKSAGNHEGSVVRHEIAPGREALVKFLNHNFGAAGGKRLWED